MSTAQQSLFGGARLQMTESIDLTIASLEAYGPRYRHWAIAWSGGKDSSALVTMLVWLILAKKITPPKTLTILYADTRLELLPLWIAADRIREELEEHAAAIRSLGCELSVRVVMAPLDERFMVYMLGRGVPPPTNMTMRWCTRLIKIEPMAAALEQLAVQLGMGAMVEGKKGPVYKGHGDEKLLVLTGVRQGESAIRDGRIAMSCGKDGAECGQGWYQETLPEALCDTLAPMLHWRVCHVWEWLKHWAPRAEYGDWTTEPIAEAYGGDEAEEVNARTGCTGCPLAAEDKGLEATLRQSRWAYLAPLRGLKRLWIELRTKPMRLRKAGGEKRRDGSLVKNQMRLGPLTMDARRMALGRILAIQSEINASARTLGRPSVDLLNAEEVARIEELIAANTYPEKWDGDEPTGDVMLPEHYADGTVQPLLFGALESQSAAKRYKLTGDIECSNCGGSIANGPDGLCAACRAGGALLAEWGVDPKAVRAEEQAEDEAAEAERKARR